MVATKTKSNSPARIFLFHGEDDYTTAAKVRQWREAFAKKHSAMGVTQIDCLLEPEEWQKKWSSVISSFGLFSAAALVVVKNMFQLKAEETEAITERLEELPADLFLLFWESAPVKTNLRLYKKTAVLEQRGLARISRHDIPSGLALNRFIEKYCKERGFKIAAAAMEKLAVLLGRDLAEKIKTKSGYEERQVYNLWQVVCELDKLGAYKAGAEIAPCDVEKLVAGKVSENIFLLTDAIGSRTQAAALGQLSDLLNSSQMSPGSAKERVLPIIGALAQQFRSLLLLVTAQKSASSPAALAAFLGWSAWRVNANLRLAKHFSEEELRAMLAKLLEIDKKIKSTSLPPKVLLGRFISSL